MFAPTWVHTAETVAQEYVELDATLLRGDRVDLARHFHTFFRYRDPAMLPTLRNAAASEATNPLQRLWAIWLLGQLGSQHDVELLEQLALDDSALVREYAARALGRIGGVGTLLFLEGRSTAEGDDYVRATVAAARRRLTGERHPGVTAPQYDARGLKKLAFFYNGRVAGGGYVQRRVPESARPALPARGFVYPHQQYRWPLEGIPPLPNFGGPLHHVGEDSGWLLQGLPIHAIADGVVCQVLYDRSWGSVVVVEHRLEDGGSATSYYAHLDHDLDVSVGQRVEVGQNLGVIGPAVSVENGGYWSHAHVGIEPVPCSEANVVGYDVDLDHYRDALSFIATRPLSPP
jgi:murein DD-endopeptidase MepM/ murein hydrolase activator NlpD